MPVDRTPEDVIGAEHVRTAFGQFPIAILAHTLNASVMVGLLWLQTAASRAALAYWLGAVFCLGALRGLVMGLYLGSPSQISKWRRWSLVAVGFAVAYGLLWAVAIGLFLDGEDPLSVILLVVIPIGLTAGAAATGAAIPAVSFGFMFIVVPTMVLVLLLCGSPLGYGLAVLAVLNLFANITISFNIHRTLDQTLALRLENEAMRTDAEEKSLVLEEARAVAERANGAKTRFLAAASHDLRQPMHALGLFFSALSERIGNDETANLVRRIDETIEVINGMLNALLDISKLDSGTVEPKLGAVSLDDLLRHIEAELAITARERGNRLRFRHCGAWVRTDPAMLERILRNLIGNALRYTDGGRVLVAGRRRGEELRLEVWDTGRGIPQDRLADIFVEFHQLDPLSDRNQGLGLGLAIVQRLARLLGHRLEVRSTPGRGSCFAIHLPMLTGQALASTRPGKIAEQVLTCDLERLRVLVLDDDRLVREAMADLLDGWGYEVDLAATLDEALAAVSERMPDLLVVDYRLPDETTGGDAIKALYTHTCRQIPALVITGDTAPDRLRESTARDFPLLHKPVQAAKLRSALRYLAKRRALPLAGDPTGPLR